MTLKSDLEKLFEGTPTALECTKFFMKHVRHGEDWPKVLRDVANYIEKLPRPIEISDREVRAIIELALGRIKRGEIDIP